MFAFIARQPILDKSKSVFAYELLFRDGKAGAYPEHNEEKAKYISEHFHPLGLDDISGERHLSLRFPLTHLYRASLPRLTQSRWWLNLPTLQKTPADYLKLVSTLNRWASNWQ